MHRELASGLSCPVGFKNGTDGNIKIAVDAIRAAQAPHHFLSVTKGGHSAIVSTTGNEDCHIILRGGKQPNYDAASVDAASKGLAEAGIPARLMIDFSHGNSSKNPQKQLDVGRDVAAQVGGGEVRIFGIMMESHLKGRAAGPAAREAAAVRREHHRRMPELGRKPRGAGRARRSGAQAPGEGRGRMTRMTPRGARGAHVLRVMRWGRAAREWRWCKKTRSSRQTSDRLGRFERVADNGTIADELGSLLGRAPLFSDFSRDDVKSLAEYMGVYRAQPGETIIREGDVGDFMLLIVRGEVDILKTRLPARAAAYDDRRRRARRSARCR